MRHLILTLSGALLIAACISQAGDIELVIEATQLHALDPRLFGQFLERPFSTETGPESLVDTNGDLPEPIVTALAGMHAPVVRFPAGTDVDFTDWTYLIDRAPGRASVQRVPTHGRDPELLVSARFGWHAYDRLAKRMGWETIAAVNLLDGLAKRKPLAEAALHAAGLIAYLNAPLGATLPAGMPDWPAIRAANGHPEPFAVRYVQLGNEWFMPFYKEGVKAACGNLTPEQTGAWYAEVLRAHVAAIRAVDPQIEIIIDANGRAGAYFLPDPVLRKEVRWVAIHAYAPQDTTHGLTKTKVTVATNDLAAGDVSAAEFWQAWTAMPGVCDAVGQNQAFGAERLDLPRALGYRVAVTEWNWNCWGTNSLPTEALAHLHRAAGIGAAQFIHGLFRRGDLIGMAVQSMMLGTQWAIAAVKVRSDGQLIRCPQGQMSGFYRAHHGPMLLQSRLSGAAIAPGTLTIGWAFAQPAVAQIDALATGGNGHYIAHLVNRGTVPLTVVIRTPATAGSATVHRLLPCESEKPDALSWFTEDAVSVAVRDGICRVEMPGMAVIAVDIAPDSKGL